MTKLKSLLLATCVGLAMTAPTFAETLSFVSWMKDDPGYGDWWQEVITEFETTHPDDKIEWTKVARSEYADTMFTMFAGGNPPDIVHLAAFEFAPFANEGWLEDLGPWIAKSDLNLDGWLGQSTCEWNGTTVCLMMLYTGYVMAYNEALLSDSGIGSVPTSWDEYLAAARATTRDDDGDGQTDTYGVGIPLKDAAGLMYATQGFALDVGGTYTVDGKPSFNSPGVIEGLRRLKQLYDEKLIPADQTSGEVRQLFIEGRIGMTVDGPWVYNTMKTATPEMQEVLKLAMPPTTPPVGGTSNVVTMPSDLSDSKKQLVWDFISIAASESFQKRFAVLGSSPAPRPGLDYSDLIAEAPYFELFIESNNAASAAGVDRLPKGLELEFNEVQKTFFQEVQRMLIEGNSPEDTAAALQAAVERIL
jgi:multiple sugar transport system substrate-binding protein